MKIPNHLIDHEDEPLDKVYEYVDQCFFYGDWN
jgi:hypothetical protein